MTTRTIEKIERGFFGKLIKWIFILFNVLMLVWMLSYCGTIGDEMTRPMSGAEQAGAAIGSTIGVTMLLMFWGLGVIILGVPTLLTRRKVLVQED